MKPVLTGMASLRGTDADKIISNLNGYFKEMRFIHDIEKIMIAGIGLLLSDAGIRFPVGNNDIGLYIGVDDAIEDIKDEYFQGIITHGILGASPLLFPFTSPNALAAQASIAFDLRGESITIPLKYSSYCDVIQYAIECVMGGYSRMAVAGMIFSSGTGQDNLSAKFSFLEAPGSAAVRRARIYH